MKKESEKLAIEAAKTGIYPSYKSALPDVSGCYFEDANGARYEIHCSEKEINDETAAVNDTPKDIIIEADAASDAVSESEETISTNPSEEISNASIDEQVASQEEL